MVKSDEYLQSVPTPKSVNEAFHRMTVAELNENLAYWKYRKALNSSGATTPGVKFITEIEHELAKRK